MVKLPDSGDPTLEASDRAIERQENSRGPREYLGMSGIGHSCGRKCWYDWRWMTKAKFNARTLKRFQDGHDGEELQAKRLRMVEGVMLITVEPETGQQIDYSDIGGHFKGHMDGAIFGLIQSPKTWHVWEHKQVGETKFNSLIKLKNKFGEKGALAEWDTIYYSQACLYMNYSGMDRHYLTCSTPGGRDTVSVRTNSDIATSARLIKKAERIIHAANPPGKISEDPSWHVCRFCDHQDACHGPRLPERHCRSCMHSTPLTEGQDAGKWHCAKHGWMLNKKMQLSGCGSAHRFIPALVKGEQIDAGENGEWIDYRMPDGSVWRDEGAKL